MSLLACDAALAQAEPNLDPIPGYYQEPGLSPNRDYANQHAQEAVDPFGGKLQLHYVDIVLPGNGGMDIKVQRSYSSGDGFLRDPSPYGIGWTMGYGRVLRKANYPICDVQHGSQVNPVLELPNGSRQILYVGDDSPTSSYFISTSRWKAVCAGAGAGLIVYSPDGTRYDMTYQGQTIGSTATSQMRAYYPVTITDRNGNTLSLTYQQVGPTDAITSVTAPDDRQVTFTYVNGILDNVKDGSGKRKFTYTTKAAPNTPPGYVFLTGVARPDGQTWKYDYNEAFDNSAGAGSIKKLTYPTGGTLSYTYDKSVQFAHNLPAGNVHVVKQKTDSAGNAWTYTYTPASQLIPAGTHTFSCPNAQGWLDMTQVTGPEGTVLYCHVGYNSISSAGTGTSSFGYAVGTLATKMSGDGSSAADGFIAAESNGFEPDLITDKQSMMRSGDSSPIAASVYGVRYFWQEKNRYTQSYQTTYSNFDGYGNAKTIVEEGTSTRPGGAKETRSTQLTYQVNTDKWILHQVKDSVTSVNDEQIGGTSRNIDGNGNLTSQTKQGVTTNWTYHPSGDVKTRTDGRGYVTTFDNYKCGIPQTESHPINAKTVALATQVAVTTRVVDSECNITSVVDPESAETKFTYDGLGRMKTIQHPLGSLVSVTWGKTTREITRGVSGNAARYYELTTYDGYGRVSEHLLRDQKTLKYLQTLFVNDAVGRHIYKSYPNSNFGVGVSYNILGETDMQGQGCPRPTSGPASLACTAWTYSAWNGNVNTFIDEKNRKTTTTFRGFGDPDELEAISIVPPDAAASTTLLRNGMGQVKQVTQGGVTRTFSYQPTTYFLGSVTDPETGVTTYGRDEVGNMTSRKVGAGPTIGYVYDGLGRVTEVDYPSGTPSILKAYYKDDKLKSVINGTISGGAIASPVVKREYEYDFNKNLKRETLTIAGAPSPFVIDRTYDNNDALDTLKYGSDQTITYTPDGFGRPTKAAPFVSALEYNDANGQVSSIQYANGVKTTVLSDPKRLWPYRITHAQGAASKPLVDSLYDYDVVGNLQLVADWVDPSYARVLGYDTLDRLVSMRGPWGTGSASYDAAGNLKSQNFGGATVNYQYDTAKNLLTSTSGARTYQYTYDNYGNVTHNGLHGYVYNDASNLKCVKCGTAAEVSYVYDGTGLRVAETGGGVTTYYVYDGSGQLLWEQIGQTSKRYAYVAGKQVAVDQVAPAGSPGVGQAGGSTQLKVTVTSNAATAAVGSDITYTVLVKNAGTQVATEVQVVDVLPPGIDFVSASSGCTHANRVVTCAVGTVAASGMVTLQIVGRTTAVTDVVNAVSVTSKTANSAPEADSLGLVSVAVKKRELSPKVLQLLFNALQ